MKGRSNGGGHEGVADLNLTSLHHSNSTSSFYTSPSIEQYLSHISKVSIMAPKNTTKAQATREDSQSDPTSQDASQDTGMLAGQMAKTFNDKAKKAVGHIDSEPEASRRC